MHSSPSFILSGAGSHLSIHGAVYTHKLIVQHLTDIYLMEATTYGDARVHHIAKVFTSLRRALDKLDDHYEGITNPLAGPPTPTTPVDPSLVPYRCFFPYPTKFKERQAGTDAKAKYIQFEYIDLPSADLANVTFFVKVTSEPPGQRLVIKFVDRYGVEAHDLLAKEIMAPRLLYCGSLDGENDVRDSASGAEGRIECGLYVGPLRMVVMDRVEPVQARGDWPGDAREQIKTAIDKLHEGGLVFGDLREPNVLFSENRAFFIDFDWAGKAGEARYPHGLSAHVDWPDEVERLERKPIEANHDDCMLDKLFPQ